jgi:hypothetical protein
MCACLVAAAAPAQRGGGGGFHGGGGGGGFHGGSGGSHGGGGGVVGGFHGGGGGIGYGFRGGSGYHSYGYGGYYGGFYSGYWPTWNFGYSYGPGYYDYSPYAYYPYSYDPSPNVTVIYPAPTQPASGTANVERANPGIPQYDEYAQPIRPASGGAAPVYLVAFKDHVIRAAEAFWVDGQMLHYVTLEHQEKQAPLDTVDRDFSLQLNRERHVPFSLPAQ